MVVVAENKWIVVTGANKGLGYELCKILLTDKHPVVVACRTQQKAEDTVERLRRETGHDITVQPLQLDPSDPASIKAGVAELQKLRDQKVGVLVNNAGMMSHEWTQSAWDDIMAVNYTGAIALAEQIVPVLAEGGRIVNVSSGLADLSALPSAAYRERIEAANSLDELRAISFDPEDAGCKKVGIPERTAGKPGVPVYRISKAMLNKATQLLSSDERLTARDITISAVCPGWCRTDLGSGQGQAPSSPQDGARSIAWNVEHKQPADINGKVYRHGEEVSPVKSI